VAEIVCEHITKIYPDGTRAVKAIDVHVEDGEFMVLVGPSGCGKTTLLKMIAGLETLSDGEIRIGGEIVNDLPARERDIGMVFQSYALYPHMSVFDNIGFSLKLRGMRRQDTRELVVPLASKLGLEDLLDKKPAQLSGGQRQRVAMARAMIRKPRVFLMDEPLSNLDAKLRVQMRSELSRIQRETGVTTIYVTHDQLEAMTLGDRVTVLRGGVVQQVGTPKELYQHPVNLFVAGFIGSPAMNLVQATYRAGGGAGATVEIGDFELTLPRPVAEGIEGSDGEAQQVAVGIRPEHMEDADLKGRFPQGMTLTARVELREEVGSDTYVYFSVNAPPVMSDETRELAREADEAALADLEQHASERRTPMIARVRPETRAVEGQDIKLFVDASRLHFFDLGTGSALNSPQPLQASGGALESTGSQQTPVTISRRRGAIC
jgi:multiple sugar transport system ATP-binding protein